MNKICSNVKWIKDQVQKTWHQVLFRNGKYQPRKNVHFKRLQCIYLTKVSVIQTTFFGPPHVSVFHDGATCFTSLWANISHGKTSGEFSFCNTLVWLFLCNGSTNNLFNRRKKLPLKWTIPSLAHLKLGRESHCPAGPQIQSTWTLRYLDSSRLNSHTEHIKAV